MVKCQTPACYYLRLMFFFYFLTNKIECLVDGHAPVFPLMQPSLRKIINLSLNLNLKTENNLLKVTQTNTTRLDLLKLRRLTLVTQSAENIKVRLLTGLSD